MPHPDANSTGRQMRISMAKGPSEKQQLHQRPALVRSHGFQHPQQRLQPLLALRNHMRLQSESSAPAHSLHPSPLSSARLRHYNPTYALLPRPLERCSCRSVSSDQDRQGQNQAAACRQNRGSLTSTACAPQPSVASRKAQNPRQLPPGRFLRLEKVKWY
jgi:hypothetical protein